jgi:hypothetical protein
MASLFDGCIVNVRQVPPTGRPSGWVGYLLMVESGH